MEVPLHFLLPQYHKSDLPYSFRKPDAETYLSFKKELISCLQKTLLSFHIPGYLSGVNLARPEFFCKKQLLSVRETL